MLVAGTKAIIAHVGTKDYKDTDPDKMRYGLFCKKVACVSKVVEATTLPPTYRTTYFHSLCAYYMIQFLKGIHLEAMKWIWVEKDETYQPIMTDIFHLTHKSCYK